MICPLDTWDLMFSLLPRRALSWRQLLCWAAGLVLILTAAAKVIGASQGERVLSERDPLLGYWDLREVLLMAALLEICVAVTLLAGRSGRRKGFCLLWIVGLFVAYRAGLRAIGFRGYCHCLGEWTTWLGLQQAGADALAVGILICLATAGIALVACHRKPLC